MKKILAVMFGMAMAVSAQADLVYSDDFGSDPIGGSVWTVDAGSAVTYDGPNTQVNYAHIAGTTRRWVSNNSVSNPFASTEGYLKAVISNFAGSSDGVWIGFSEDNPSNNANYITADVVGDGTFEIVFNNSASSIAFDNGAGWAGTLAANSGFVTTNGGGSTTALTFGAQVDSGTNLKGFGFANFGNATVFPSASFSIDSIEVHGTAVVPEPSVIALLGMGFVALLFRRKARR